MCGPSEVAATCHPLYMIWIQEIHAFELQIETLQLLWHHTIVNYNPQRFTARWHSGFLLKEEKLRWPRGRACWFLQFPLLYFFLDKHFSSENLRMRRRNIWDIGQQTKQEPVSGTARCGARAAYHVLYPRDFGPWYRFYCELSFRYQSPPTLCRPSKRPWGGEMSTPRPLNCRISAQGTLRFFSV